ncbi:MAG: DUF1697 domain-containing protein [Urechidicola sp.]|nr:DUF1697 domain-containing protein [Urechidicola sp.]
MNYIALLRGINVGGHKKILMADLKELLINEGLNNVQTYIQSGNVIFESDENQTTLSKNISTYIYKEYQFEVPVLIKTVAEWEVALNNNPFLKDDSEVDIKKLYVTFLSDTPTKENAKNLLELDYSPDKFALQDNLIYSYYPNGSGKSKMTINIFEKKLKVSATSRNWNTINKLFELLSSKKHN